MLILICPRIFRELLCVVVRTSGTGSEPALAAKTIVTQCNESLSSTCDPITFVEQHRNIQRTIVEILCCKDPSHGEYINVQVFCKVPKGGGSRQKQETSAEHGTRNDN